MPDAATHTLIYISESSGWGYVEEQGSSGIRYYLLAPPTFEPKDIGDALPGDLERAGFMGINEEHVPGEETWQQWAGRLVRDPWLEYNQGWLENLPDDEIGEIDVSWLINRVDTDALSKAIEIYEDLPDISDKLRIVLKKLKDGIPKKKGFSDSDQGEKHRSANQPITSLPYQGRKNNQKERAAA